MPPNTPPAEETKAKILAVYDQDWLDEKLSELDEQFKGSIKDPALKLWLVATNNGVEVEEIKMESGGSGTPIVMAEVNEELVRDQMARGDRERDFFQVEGVVLNLRHGETQKKKPKTEFELVDATGKRTVTAYSSAMEVVAQAKIKDGDYVRLPLTQILANQFEPDRRNPQGRLWYTITLPPFGQIIRIQKDADEVFKNFEADAMKRDDPVFAQGVITHIQERHNDTCTICNRWYSEGKEEEHAECEGMEIMDVVSYEATMVTGSGQYLKLKFGRDGKRPAVKEKADLVKVYGFWTEKGNLQVHKYVVLAGPSLKKGAKPMVAAKAPAKVVPAPVKPKVAPKAPKAPVVPDEAEEGAEEPEEAPAPAPKPKVPVRAPVKRAPAPQPPEDETSEESEEEPEEAPAPPPVRKLPPKAPVKAPVRKAAPPPEPEPEEDAPAEDPEQIEEQTEEAEEEPVVVRPATKTPVAAKAPLAPKAVPKAPAVTKPAVPAKVAPKPAAKAPVASGDVPEEFVAHVQKYCAKFGGRNRVLILINTAIQGSVVPPEDGEDEESLKTRIRSYIDQMAAEGSITFEDEKRLTVALAS